MISGLHFAASSVRLDASPELAALAETSPQAVLVGDTPRLVDEWQLAPTLWNAVRHEVDIRGVPGQFVLTGSATPSDDVTRHSGAGRFHRVTLRPMSLAESGDSTGAVAFASLFDGADVRVDPLRMRALIRALARNVATEMPATRLGTEAEIEDGTRMARGVSAQSARKYLDTLTRVFVLEEQPAWAPHLRSRVRLRVQPKWHFVDPSLAAAALGAGPQSLLDDVRTLGLLFESLCIRDLRVYAQSLDGSVFHYRDEVGLEVDAIVELRDGRWSAFEVRLGSTASINAAASNLSKLAAKVSAQRAERLCSLKELTAGTTSHTRPDRVNVIALGHLGYDG